MRGDQGPCPVHERQADSQITGYLGEDGQEPHLQHLQEVAHLRQNPGGDLRREGRRHRRRGSGVPPPTGTLTVTLVPSPGRLLISIFPPNPSTRSRIPTSPMPVLADPGSNPRPSSATSIRIASSSVRNPTSTFLAAE